MASSFLFINEDQLSYVQRPRGVPSSVRGHARKYRTSRIDRHTRLENCQQSTRIICPKIPGTSATEYQTSFTSDHLEDDEEVETGLERFATLQSTSDIASNRSLNYHILQLDDETQRLVQFYLLWNVSEAHSNLPCALSWPKTIVSTAFDSDPHSLVLACYIASMASYLSQKLNRSQGEASKSSSQSPTTYSDFDSDSAPSSRSPASPPQTFINPTADPPKLNLPPTSHPTIASEAWTDSQCSQNTRPSLAQRSRTYRSAKTGSPTPNLQQDFALSRSLSYPSRSDHDTSLPAPSDVAQLTHIALKALQSQISGKNISSFSSSLSSELLFPVWCLFRSAIFQGDFFAALSHQRFLRHLVFRTDGSQCPPSWLVDVIVEVDLDLVLSRQETDGCDKGSSALLVMSELRERMAEGP